MKRLRRLFMTGVITITPVGLSVMVLVGVFNWLDRVLGRMIQSILLELGLPYIPGLGFILLVLVILGVGFLTQIYVGRQLILVGQRFVERIPFLSKLVRAVRQIMDSFVTSKSELFRQAVLVQYPRQGIWSIGFLTRRAGGEIRERLRPQQDNRLLSVFIPTTPNPTSGMLVYVPEDDVILLEMSVEEAVKLVVSGGALVNQITPGERVGRPDAPVPGQV
ncbi:MAG: DUF502 domain-containing protein [Candidatus Delongbacteria bacterium]